MITRTILQALQRIEEAVASFAYITVAALLISDVLGRELFGTSFLGAQKLAIYAAIVASFLGLSLATSAGAHLRPEIFDRLFSARHDRAVNRLSDLFAALFFAGMGLVAVHFVAQSAEFGDKPAIFYFPLWPIQLVMPYAFFSCAFRHLAYALHPELRPQGVLA